jgi:succinate dehydrogenase / fumarate reductase membrane anchor subunit
MTTSPESRSPLLTPLRRVRGLGAAREGTHHFWATRFTAVVLVPLTIVFIVIVIALLGRNHAATLQILGSPPVAILMLLFVLAGTYHMWLGMQEIVLDYVHADLPKMLLLMANTSFSIALGIACAFATFKLSFGV